MENLNLPRNSRMVQRALGRFLCLVALICPVSTTVAAGERFVLKSRGVLPGLDAPLTPPYAIKIHENQIHIHGGTLLMLVDVSNPDKPQRLGTREKGWDWAWATTDRFAYYGTTNSFEVYGISLPGKFTKLGECGYGCPTNNPYARCVPEVIGIQGRYAYVVGRKYGANVVPTPFEDRNWAGYLWIIDVLDPVNPVFVGGQRVSHGAPSLHNSQVSGYNVALAGDFSYITYGWDGISGPNYYATLNLVQVDVKNAQTPLVSRDNFYDIASVKGWGTLSVSGHRVYYLEGGYFSSQFPTDSYLYSSDTRFPYNLTTTMVGKNVTGFSLKGDRGMFSHGGVEVMELGDQLVKAGPPRRLAQSPDVTDAVAVTWSGDFAYMATTTFGLRIFEVISGTPEIIASKADAHQVLITGNDFAQGLPLQSGTNLTLADWHYVKIPGSTNVAVITKVGLKSPISSGAEFFRVLLP